MYDVRNLQNRLRKSYKATSDQQITESTMITDNITGIIALWTGRVQDSGAAIADSVATPIWKYNKPRIFWSG